MSKNLMILVLAASAFLCACEGAKRSAGEDTIRAIEAYKVRNGRLPDSLTDVGIVESEEGPIYYRRQSEDSYELWYGATLGESETYDSRSKKWN